MKEKTLKEIASLFGGDDEAILYALVRKGYLELTAAEFEMSGFEDEKIIAQRPTPGEHVLFARSGADFHPETHYKGVTVVTTGSGFKLEENTLSEMQASLKNAIRDQKNAIEGLENNIWAQRFELDNPDIADLLEERLKNNLLEIEALERQLAASFDGNNK